MAMLLSFRLIAEIPCHLLCRWLLTRCSTSVASNYRAVCIAQSKASFISKLSIVIEETDETHFGLEFIIDEKIIKNNLVTPLLQEAEELTSVFVASRKTDRGRQ